MVSALKEENIDMLRHKIFQELKLIRIFLKTPTGEADLEHPLFFMRGTRLKPSVGRSTSNLWTCSGTPHLGEVRQARGQKFSTLDHVIEDGDIITIYLRR